MPKGKGIRRKEPKSGWYIVQVRTGQEDRMCSIIERVCSEHDAAAEAEGESGERLVGLKECFSPRFATQRKWKGEFQDVERALLPGYVIADTSNPAMLAESLRGVHDLCRILATDKAYAPLDEHERLWIESQTRPKERIIPLSFGYKEGEKLMVTDGPLAGHEAMIVKVDRKNSLAHIEFHIDQITIKTQVGLVVMPSGKVRVVSG